MKQTAYVCGCYRNHEHLWWLRELRNLSSWGMNYTMAKGELLLANLISFLDWLLCIETFSSEYFDKESRSLMPLEWVHTRRLFTVLVYTTGDYDNVTPGQWFSILCKDSDTLQLSFGGGMFPMRYSKTEDWMNDEYFCISKFTLDSASSECLWNFGRRNSI